MAKWDNLIILNRIVLHPEHSHCIRSVQRRVCDSLSCRSQWANMLHWDNSLLFKQHPVWFLWNKLPSKTKRNYIKWSQGKVKIKNAAYSQNLRDRRPADLGWGFKPRAKCWVRNSLGDHQVRPEGKETDTHLDAKSNPASRPILW